MYNVYRVYDDIADYVAQKCTTKQNAISWQPTEILKPKFQDLQGKDFPRVTENFTKIFSLLQKLQLSQYSIPYFKTTLKMDSYW